ncbi:MAG: hypothetical protein U0L11_06525, partial [Acutalibacteraceae bacterium]|nr:hypothetical protein [Acutalibacteraceae bacterium]
MKLGSKIENLALMKIAGLPVPDFETFAFSELVESSEKIENALREGEGKTAEEKSRLLKKAVKESVAVS